MTAQEVLDAVDSRVQDRSRPRVRVSEAEIPCLPWPTRLRDVVPAAPLGYRVGGLIVRDEMNAIVGDGGAGKTGVLLALGGALASGAMVFGDRATEPGPVLFVSGEDS